MFSELCHNLTLYMALQYMERTPPRGVPNRGVRQVGDPTAPRLAVPVQCQPPTGHRARRCAASRTWQGW